MNLLEGLSAKTERGQTWIDAPQQSVHEAVLALKSQGARLISISGVDDQTDMKVYYHFDLENKVLNLCVALPKGTPVIPSIVTIYPNADLYERELHEMFNILITGHPGLTPLFLSKDLQGKAPLRKEFKGVKD